MRYLVTGGAGFIGSNIVEELIKRGEFVRVLDNFSTGKRENLNGFDKEVELVEGDIRDFDIVKRAAEGVDVVLHHAAQLYVQDSINNPIFYNDVNVGGTLNMLHASKESGINKFVFVSSSAIYGDLPELPKHEGMKSEPLSPYAASKLAGEEYCRMYAKLHGIKTVILRYFNIFGPKQNPSSEYSGVISKFIKQISNDERPIIFGDGRQTRDFTYVANVVDANILAATLEYEPGIILNTACNTQININYLVKQINLIFKKNIKPEYVSQRKGDIIHSYANIDLIKRVLGWKPRIGFEEGLKRTIRNTMSWK